MELLRIGIKDEVDKINDILDKKINVFEKEDLNIDRKTSKVGDVTFFSYNLSNEKKCKYNNIKNIFKHYIASGISDIVLELYQEKIIEKILNERYFYLNNEEKNKIKKSTLEYLDNNDYITTEGIMYKISKKAKVLKSILEYLDFSNEINIEGFVNFRLKFFIDMIEEAIDKTIEDFIIEKEYKEFIKILQYFVDIQEPKIDLINVVLRKEQYNLYDKNSKVIKNDFMEEIADEMLEHDMNYDDLLISSLITIAPSKIVIHADDDNKENQVIEVIENIFENKTTVCEGCELCNSNTAMRFKNKVNANKEQ